MIQEPEQCKELDSTEMLARVSVSDTEADLHNENTMPLRAVNQQLSPQGLEGQHIEKHRDGLWVLFIFLVAR